MAKRFIATDIWDEDWFCKMPMEYKLFWFYILTQCNHAGIFRVNTSKFNWINKVRISTEKALLYFNEKKNRVREISETAWLVEEFFSYQYGETFNINNKVHKSVLSVYNQLNIDLRSLKGLKRVELTLKEKDKDIINIDSTIVSNSEKYVKKNSPVNFRAQTEDFWTRRISEGEQKLKLNGNQNNSIET